MKFKAVTDVFFDLDHTLWDFEQNSALTFKKILNKHGVDVDLDAFLSTYNPINYSYWKQYRENKISKEDLRFNRLSEVFTALKIKIAPQVIHALSEDYILYLSTFKHLLPGAFDLLKYLKSKYNLHIITNGFEDVQKKKMTNANITEFFSVIVTSETINVKKPDSRIFLEALRLANTKANKSVMVGDNFEADIEAALSLGFNAIHLSEMASRDTTDENYYCVNHLSQIKTLL